MPNEDFWVAVLMCDMFVQNLTIFLTYGVCILQVSPCTERAVLDQLVGYLESRLAGYPTTLDEDEAMVMSLVDFYEVFLD